MLESLILRKATMFLQNQLKILNRYSDWKAKIIGDENRKKIILKHKNADVLGFQKIMKKF